MLSIQTLLIFRVLFLVTINCSYFYHIHHTYFCSQHLFNSITRSSSERYENNEKRKKKGGGGWNKTTHKA